MLKHAWIEYFAILVVRDRRRSHYLTPCTWSLPRWCFPSDPPRSVVAQLVFVVMDRVKYMLYRFQVLETQVVVDGAVAVHRGRKVHTF